MHLPCPQILFETSYGVRQATYSVKSSPWNIMSKRLEAYDAAYGNFSNKVLQQVRKEAFGDDIGQNSWILPTRVIS
jgi:hypothetical protein